MIRVKDLYFRYEDEKDEGKFALSGINLHIKEGEFVCIIGHNGSGKSTLSKLLNGIYPPTKGSIHIAGLDSSDPSNIWKIRNEAGMVFQNPDNQLVATIVEEDVAFGPENLGVPQPEIVERVAQALKRVGMYEYRKKAPSQLSGGQKQRIAIAGILAMQPSCIIFDEPTAMLDPLGRKEVMETIRSLNKELGKTILHVTHHMDEVIDADRIIVMNEGKIVLEGTPREIFLEIEKLKRIGLDVPQVTQISYQLLKGGLIDRIALSVDELIEILG